VRPRPFRLFEVVSLGAKVGAMLFALLLSTADAQPLEGAAHGLFLSQFKRAVLKPINFKLFDPPRAYE